MATYAIGDVQGCYERLLALLTYISFSPDKDTLWFCGDLINRGPSSLATLRFIKSLTEQGAARPVLGNHDLHCLAIYYGAIKEKPGDTLDELYAAPDCKQLLDWLQQQPILVTDTTQQHVMIHAGLHPNWNIKTSISLAEELATAIRNQAQLYFSAMYGDEPSYWDNNLTGVDRWRVLTNIFTRMRYFHPDFQIDLQIKSAVEDAPSQLTPWYQFRDGQQDNCKILFGHWAALRGKCDSSHCLALDTGCGWGGTLTAYCLETAEYFQVPGLQKS